VEEVTLPTVDAGLVEAWRELAAEAVEPNRSISPEVALVASRWLPEGADVRVHRGSTGGADGPCQARVGRLVPAHHSGGCADVAASVLLCRDTVGASRSPGRGPGHGARSARVPAVHRRVGGGADLRRWPCRRRLPGRNPRAVGPVGRARRMEPSCGGGWGRPPWRMRWRRAQLEHFVASAATSSGIWAGDGLGCCRQR
jgi:hypothetical protein